MEQYRKGELFVRAIAARRGPAALTRLWDGPETLPRDGEIDAPDALDRRASSTTAGACRASRRAETRGRPGPRPGRRPDGDRAEPDPVGPLPLARSRADPRRRARRAARHGVRRGLADGPLDDVEVMLRGWLSSEAFDRLLARAPHLPWVHSATAGVERALTPAGRERGLVVTNARGVFSRPIAEYVLMMILAVSRRLPAAPRAAARADVAAARGRRAARRHGRDRRSRLDRARGRGAGDGVRVPGGRGPAPTATARQRAPSGPDDEDDRRSAR